MFAPPFTCTPGSQSSPVVFHPPTPAHTPFFVTCPFQRLRRWRRRRRSGSLPMRRRWTRCQPTLTPDGSNTIRRSSAPCVFMTRLAGWAHLFLIPRGKGGGWQDGRARTPISEAVSRHRVDPLTLFCWHAASPLLFLSLLPDFERGPVHVAALGSRGDRMDVSGPGSGWVRGCCLNIALIVASVVRLAFPLSRRIHI